jgi:hypothetical protein
MEKIFKYGFKIKPKNMKIWHVVLATNPASKTITELELQITYAPVNMANVEEPYCTKLTVQDNEQSIDFALKQLQNAIKSWENGEIMTIFDEQNNIKNLKHISQRGSKNGK